MARKKKESKKILQSIVIIFLCSILIGGTTGFFLLSHIIGKVNEQEMTLKDKIFNLEPTTVYDRNGKVIAEIGAESREIITYEQIPQVTIDAFLAIEDSRYFKHNGFDLPRFLSSAVNNIRSSSFAQGGSTLTMQTIDNFIIKPKEEKDAKEGITYNAFQKIESKIQEIYLSIRLESLMSKEEIITAYLNKINFGYTTRGIQRGAQYYFGKNVEELNLSESAFLAGVINAPNSYNPYYGFDSTNDINYYQQAINRRNDTLNQMLNHGYITKEEHDLATSCELAFQLNGSGSETSNPYQAYINAALHEAREITGEDPVTTPMKIYTALDTNAQDAINKVLNNEVINMPDNEYYQVATSIIDNATGEIVAIGAGFDNPYTTTYRDRANNERHQPGSTVKPLIDYALAFDELGWCTQRVLDDSKLEIYGQPKKNYDNQFHGKVTIERALSQSLNIPAFKTLQALVDEKGYDYMRDYMRKLGFDESVCEKFDLLFAIGGANFLASPTQMANAFSIFANEGQYKEATMIQKIEYKDKSKTFTPSATTTQVISSQAAFMISDLLNKAVVGEWSGYNFMASSFAGCGYPVYGKTGTSDWGDFSQQVGGSIQDIWMVNYTSEYTIATWTGFDARVDGYSYISSNVQNMNIPGRINRYLFDTISYQPHKIAKPNGVSEYGGGYIKTEFLADAAKNNPETLVNMSKDLEALQDLIEQLSKLDPSNYDAESFKNLQAILKEAEDLISDYTSDEDVKDVLNRLNIAKDNLVSIADNNQLQSLWNEINNASQYTNVNIYNSDAVNNLLIEIENAKNVANIENVTNNQIDEAIKKLKAAIQACLDSTIQIPSIPDVPAPEPIPPVENQ